MFAHRNDRAFTYLISISLFLGAFFCLFLAKQVHTINRTQSVSIDLKQVFWWKDAKFNFDQTQIASATIYPEIKTKITPIRLIKKISKQVHHIKLQKFDKIITQSAAAVEQTEQQKLLSVYKLLRTKFILAVNTHDETSHALATLISHTNPNATPKVVPKIIPKPTISIMPNVISKAIPKIISNTIQNTIPSSITNIINNKQDTENKKPSDKFFNNFSSNSNFPIVAKKKEQQRVPEYRVNNVIDHQTEPHVGNLANKSVVAKSNTTPIDSGFSVSLPLLSQLSIQNNARQNIEYPVKSPPPEYSQHKQDVPNKNDGILPDKSDNKKGKKRTEENENRACVNGELQEDENLDTKVYEAFDSGHSHFYAKSRIFSHEGGRCKDQSKWIASHTPYYWDTLSWWNFSQSTLDQTSESNAVLLLSKNTALFLAKLINIPLQESAGIVFGKVPAGYLVEFSGRAEAPIYLDEKTNQMVSSDNVQSNRNYVFLNVEPGAHLIYLRHEKEVSMGVATPVIAQYATRLDLGLPQILSFTGKVSDGSARELRGLREISIKVVGQERKNTISKTDGEFELKAVYFMKDYPLYLETEDKHGYTHRHRISFDSVRELVLFHFHHKQIRKWINQVEGVVSAVSGVVIGALPSLIRQYENSAPLPKLFPLMVDPPVLPESYTISEEDSLETNRPLEAKSPRFISIEVPEGVNLCSIENKEGTVLFSKLVLSSSGIVNVLGPSELR